MRICLRYALMSICACPFVASAVTYEITDLGTYYSIGTQSAALSVNNLGQVAMQTYDGTNYHAQIWSNGTFTDLGFIGGSFAKPAGINDAGQVSGMAHTVQGGTTRAFLYSGGTMQSLGSLNGTNESYAWGINANGHVTGYSFGAGGTAGAWHAFLWNGSTMVDLGSGGVSGSDSSYGRAVNVHDQVGGFTYFAGETSDHAAIWSSGTWTPVPYLATGARSQIYGLNDAGDATGYSYLAGTAGIYHAFLYEGGTSLDLGTVTGSGNSLGRWVNNSGTVVGWDNPSATQHAMIYTGGTMTDLNSLIDGSLGWTLQDAHGISDTGYIVGYGTIGGARHVYLLSPVPEPATLAVLGIGVLALLRRRKKA